MIPRRTPLPRSRKRIKARYRTKGGRHSDLEKLSWIRRQPCLCAPSDPEHCTGPVEAHHERRRGARATDEATLPLCEGHHRLGPTARHVLGPRRFEERHLRHDLETVCLVYHTRYLAARGPAPEAR